MTSSPLDIATLGGQTMGTTWSAKLVAGRNRDLHALHAGIQARLDTVVAQMSTWEPQSDISRYNRAAGGWQRLPPEFFNVLQAAQAIARSSGGAFDPTVGPMVELWGFGAGAHPQRVPAAAEIAAVAARVGWQRLELRPDGHEALQPGGLQLDLSAIAKGFGVDLATAWLRQAGIDAALVEVGGELAGYGRKPDGAPWQVLVESAPEEDDAAGLPPRVLALDGMAVATSGDRWHRFDAGGQRYSHTFDARLGRPVVSAAAAVTVVAEDAMHADGWATALTVMGAQAGLELAEREGLAARFLVRDGNGLRETFSGAFAARMEAGA
ncbi:FAD:protein FMN transferase [Stenotrophomonas sp. MMGLT7]|uniref:FAD:protein FMN transferase n=1 Tax=Stenotrophomonas sp. MMGLT7 TaxID=2901227 RepID=UPI001E5EB5AF|nr:FAD:protein FMN transferase [Stenotrophomonas sp. MMGLT7]